MIVRLAIRYDIKPTNERKCMKYKTHTHTVYLLHVSATHVAIFRER